jgi:7,8-dihydropterin-6-yl-methyl-4-(beta-D-ribofuranosyl)aminobenzene 5'-phosphate synthase
MHFQYWRFIDSPMCRPQAGRFRRFVCLVVAAAISLLLPASITRASDDAKPGGQQQANQPGTGESRDMIELRIVFDNNPSDEELETAWGFACVITGCEKTILFDTGGDGKMLLRNMEKCGIDPKAIDAVVLSHNHGDHTAGLAEFLKINGDVEVYLPKVFPDQFKNQVRQAAAKVVETEEPQKVCEGVWTTGVLHQRVSEQGIYIRSAEGIVVVTGCAHPGIVEMTEAAKAHAKEPVRFVMGGFHLVQASPNDVDRVIEGLNKLDVKQVAATHCTGDKARAQMKQELGERYVGVGAGSRLVFQAPPENKPPA